MTSSSWDPQRYQGRHSYVWQFGESLLELLQPRPGERILDVGCGTGQLTAEIARSGAEVTGLDNSPDMLAQARKNYPQLKFVAADAAGFQVPEPFDAVFSNAALHWVKDQPAAAASIARALKPGGRFVTELGGKGCIASIISAMRDVFGAEADQRRPWTFPSIGEFAPLLEQHGLEVRQASLFDRPTPVEGEHGLEDWLRMFCSSYFRGLSPEQTRDALRALADRLRPALYRDGVWTLDYRRLRVVAVKPNR
ncbi:MAG: methyltransferase domain-containing protein [Acidobacteriia bacterium]|nr:methyltransferase domain-containing protein [Terriglobia bacterium]